MPIIKADAYGHDAVCVSGVLEEEGIDLMSVGLVSEALALRSAGVRSRLVALMGFIPGESAEAVGSLDDLAHAGVLPLVHSRDCLARLGDSALSVALKVDTGMSRLGFTVGELPAVLDYLAARPGIQVAFVLSHLAAANEPEQDACTLEQARHFFAAADLVRRYYPQMETSLANSPGLMRWPELRAQDPNLPEFPGDYVRPGGVLYGINPFAGTTRAALGGDLLQVMEVTTRVLAVHDLRAGQAVSYGCTFRAPADMRVAVVAAGYDDGYPRSLSNCGHMFLGGRLVPVLGRVCMQMCVVDVTDVPDVRCGDTVWLLGFPETADPLSVPFPGVDVWELARTADTIPYELLCMLGRNQHVLL